MATRYLKFDTKESKSIIKDYLVKLINTEHKTYAELVNFLLNHYKEDGSRYTREEAEIKARNMINSLKRDDVYASTLEDWFYFLDKDLEIVNA